jgi:hypothetical protein
MKYFTIFLTSFLIIISSSGLSFAEPIAMEFTAEVSQVYDFDNVLGGAISVGDTMTGTYTYDSATPDSSSSPGVSYIGTIPRLMELPLALVV